MHIKRISAKLSQGNHVVRGAFHSQQATQELVVYPFQHLGDLAADIMVPEPHLTAMGPMGRNVLP